MRGPGVGPGDKWRTRMKNNQWMTREEPFQGWDLGSSIKAFLVTSAILAISIWSVAASSGM